MCLLFKNCARDLPVVPAPIIKFLEEIFPGLKDDEIQLLAEINDQRDIENLARKHGLDDKAIKARFK